MVWIECLHCGEQRLAASEAGSCARCGYVGWALSSSLDELARRRIRELSLVERRARSASTLAAG